MPEDLVLARLLELNLGRRFEGARLRADDGMVPLTEYVILELVVQVLHLTN